MTSVTPRPKIGGAPVFFKSMMGVGLAAVLSVASGSAQTPPSHYAPPSPDAPLTVTALRGGAYWVRGGISNTGFIIGDKGVIVIDAQMFAVTAKNEQAQIAKLTSLPVNEIII